MSNVPENRRKKIVSILEESDYAEVSQLSTQFRVSEMTIRRDLEFLEKAGDVIRVYGGVKLKTKRVHEASIEKRLNTNKAEKMAIAREASKLIEDGDVIAFDASTTAYEVSKLIKTKKKLTVVTNNISIAIELSDAEDVTVILLGGFLRGKSLSLVGASLRKYLQSIFIDKAFISSKALNFTEGLTDATIDEGEAKQALIGKSSQVIVLVDHTKLGKLAFFEVCKKDKIDKIITDELETLLPDQEECIECYLSHGIPVIRAK
ncbi:DeoR/GlpR transcriptional regulator [Neobacillus notoginsengisoli]|uniref:DeoR/GlpR transcriptional regulator n=1 Tax=Neobacillus notoginsengisoli TaxID=1578198 RepID=A0A417YQ20_9BACI|nr:DeoR/GlpR family DNA-binding transcription regulator [Neobacillus notoginsengisoli]RHW35769.1 DeoR/GlpR transcriptional regulator [Neobacillus notoginsengisoli]